MVKKGEDQGSAAQSALPLFYSKPVALDAKAHQGMGLKKNFGFHFSKNVNAVPVNVIELPQICHFYPVAFSPDDTGTPVAILGLRDNENLFVNEQGEWADHTYIPAYIRRYPFIFSEVPGQDSLTLCIDMTDAVTEKNGDQTFFDKDGKATQLSTNALEFCKSYHAAAAQTMEFGKALVAHDVLVERQVQIGVGGDRKINFSGFKIVDEKKLGALDDQIFLEWRRKGWLPFLYAQLFSGAQWQRLSMLMTNKLEQEAA